MSADPYKKFFTKAQQVKREDTTAPKFTVKRKTLPSAKMSVEQNERRLRGAVRMRKAKPPFPMKAVIGLVVSFIAVVGYVAVPEVFESLFSKIEISTFGQAQAADAKPAEKSSEPAAEAEKSAATEKSGEKAKGTEEKEVVSQEFSHFEKLKQRKEELDMREKELTELEEELQRQKVELDKRIQQLEGMRNQIAQTLKDRVEVDQEKVNKLVDLYSNMKPKQAADVIGSITEDLAVEVLAKMKKKNAAEIMNLLSPEKARVLSEKYTGYRRTASSGPDPKL